MKDINKKPMYVLVAYKEAEAAQIAKSEMNNYFLEGQLLKTKTRENRAEERADLRTVVVLNIPPSVRPETLQGTLGGYGRIVQLEVPLLDLLKYDEINKALRTSGSKGLRKGQDQFAEVVKGDEKRKNQEKDIKDNIAKFSKVEAFLQNNLVTQGLEMKADQIISNFIRIKEEDIGKIIKARPTNQQLFDKDKIMIKDDIDVGELGYVSPTLKRVKDLEAVFHLEDAEYYLKHNRDKLKELYKIFTEGEVTELVLLSQIYFPLTRSVDEAVDHILANLALWKKKNIQPSSEEGIKKEKALVEALLNTQAKQKLFQENYKNYYEELYSEISSVNPSAVDPKKGVAEIQKLRASKLLDAESTNAKLQDITMEDLNREERELRRKKLEHKGYCFVTFSTTDEAKKFMLETETGDVEMQNQKLSAILKNSLDHKHFDLEYLVARTEHESKVLDVNLNAEVAEKLVKCYEDNMPSQLPGFHNLLKFRDMTFSLLDGGIIKKPFRPLAEPAREEILSNLKKAEQKFPQIDFGPLYITEELINARVEEHRAAFIAYKNEKLRKAGLLVPSQKERVDELMKRNPAVAKVKSLIGKQEKGYDLIGDAVTPRELVGRYRKGQLVQKEFLEEYLKSDIKSVESRELGFQDPLIAGIKKEKMSERYVEKEKAFEQSRLVIIGVLTHKVDNDVLSYAKHIASLEGGKQEDLEQFLQRKAHGLPAGKVQPKAEEKPNQAIPGSHAETLEDYYKLLARSSLNDLSPTEYFGVMDSLIGLKRLNKTSTGEEYIKPSDIQRMENDADLLCRYLTGGVGVNSFSGDIFELQNYNNLLVRKARGESLTQKEEIELGLVVEELTCPVSQNKMLKLLMAQQGVEREYYFDSTQGVSLDAHLKQIRAVPGVEVEYKEDAPGIYLVKKKLSLQFKYNIKEIASLKQLDLDATAYRRLDNLLNGVSLTRISSILPEFGINADLGELMLGSYIPEIDEKSKEKIWGLFSNKANGDMSFESFEAEIRKVAKEMPKAQGRVYVDASSIKDQVQSIVKDEFDAVKFDQERFHKEIAMQIEIERLKKLEEEKSAPIKADEKHKTVANVIEEKMAEISQQEESLLDDDDEDEDINEKKTYQNEFVKGKGSRHKGMAEIMGKAKDSRKGDIKQKAKSELSEKKVKAEKSKKESTVAKHEVEIEGITNENATAGKKAKKKAKKDVDERVNDQLELNMK